VVEQSTDNREIGGSNPSLSTIPVRRIVKIGDTLVHVVNPNDLSEEVLHEIAMKHQLYIVTEIPDLGH
jgi:hypothetical protein